MNPWEQNWGSEPTAAAPWEQDWEVPKTEAKKERSDVVVENGRRYKVNPITGAKAPIFDPFGLEDSAAGAAIASGIANIPGAAAGTAAFGALANNPTIQRLPPALRVGIPLAGAVIGGASGAIAARPAAERLMPELPQMEQEFPTATALGAALSEAPFFRVGGGVRLAERALGAGLGGGIQAGQELIGDPQEGALSRIAVATGAGAAFTDPNKLGRSVMDLGASVNRGPNITGKLGNASTKNTTVEAQAASNEIALAEPPALPIPQMPQVDQMVAQKQAGKAAFDAAPPFKQGESKVEIPDPDTGMPLVVDIGGPLGDFQPENPFVPVDRSTTEVFNRRVKGIIDNLAKEGVQLDRQTAVKLARTTDRKEFNAARQKLIDSVKPPEVPAEGALPKVDEMGNEKPVAKEAAPKPAEPAKAEVPAAPAKTNLDIKKVPSLKDVSSMTGAEFSDYYRKVNEAYPDGSRNITVDAMEIGAQAKTPEAQQVLKMAHEAVDAEMRAAVAKKDFDEAMNLGLKSQLFREAYEYSTKTGGFTEELNAKFEQDFPAKEPVSKPIEQPGAPETPVTEQKPVNAKETAPEAHPRQAELDAAIDRVMEFDLDPEAKKSQVVAAAKKYAKAGLIQEKYVAELQRIAKDRDMGVEDVARELQSTLEMERARPQRGVQQAGESGIIYNPFSTGTQGQKLSQINRIDFDVHGDGTYSVDGFSQSGVRSGRQPKYGKVETPLISFRGTEEELRRAFGDAVADKIVKEANTRIFNDAPESVGAPQDIIASGKIEGLNATDFKSKFGTQAGSVINPFDGQPSALGRAALERANEPLLERMAKVEVENAPRAETTASVTPQIEFPKQGEGRAQPKSELKDLSTVAYDDKGLKPIRDSITGKEIPENIAANAKIIHERLTQTAKSNNSPEPTKELATEIAKAEEWKPGLTDLSVSFPWTGKVGLSQSVGLFAKAARRAVGTIRGNIRAVSPRIEGLLQQKTSDLNEMRLRFIAGTKNLGDLSRKSLTPDEFKKLDAANLSGNREAAMAVFKGKPNEQALIDAYESHQAIMREALELERELGRDVGEVENYFRRSLIDRDGLLKALGRDGEDLYEDLVKQAGATTQEEKDKVLNNLISGSAQNRGGKGWLKPRTIDEISENLLKYYEPFDVATQDYVMGVTKDISNRRYFGKTTEDGTPFEGNIGKVLAEEKGKIGREGFKIVEKNLRDYLTNATKYDDELTTWANRARKLQTYAYLADVGSALIQGGEFFNSANKYGFANAIKGLGDSKRFGLKDLNILESNPDMVSMRRGRESENVLAKGVHGAEKVFQSAMKNFIQRADEYMTGAGANAAWRYASDVARKPDSKEFAALNEKYSKTYPERWPKMLEAIKSEDFRNGKLNPDSAFFLFNEVSSLKPISAADKAQFYNSTNPWGKLLYSLRTYPIKQLDVMREIGYEKIKQGNVKEGLKNLAAYAVIVGMGQQALNYGRDVLFNREQDESEYLMTGALQLAMIPRFAFYKAKQDGLLDAVISTTVPGYALMEDVWKDTQTGLKAVSGHRDSDGARTVADLEDFFKQSRMVQYAPGVGRPIYWWLGKGAEQEKKAEQDRLEGKSRPGTLETISDIIIPPDRKVPREN